MLLLLAAAALPTVFWDKAADTASALRDAGISHIAVPSAQVDAWKGVTGITVEAGDLEKAVKLVAPAVNYRIDQASASRAPWVDANGWMFQRNPTGRFYYDVAGKQAGLAAAEAFCYGIEALIRTDADGLKPLAEMLAFLRTVRGPADPALADVGFIDDGSFTAGEVMNLMTRNNLLYKIVSAPDPHLGLNVRLGTAEYPLAEAENPAEMAHKIRGKLGDEKRLARIYGSPVVVVRVAGSGGRLRVHLLNYSGAQRTVDGLRVRVLGRYPKHTLASAGDPGAELLDFTADAKATEFTLRELKTYAVIDLSR